jgi:hypothetical protein
MDNLNRSIPPKYSIGIYDVPVLISNSTLTLARLEPAKREDMPVFGTWCFDWRYIWDNTEFDYQSIIKISYNNSIMGLIRYAAYPDIDTDEPYLLEILHLETVPKKLKLVEPLGKWLIWYAVEVALIFCKPKLNEPLIYLDSVEEAIAYYKDIIKMEPLGWVTLAPGEEGYAFRFIKLGAEGFSMSQKRLYGHPARIDS